MIESTRIMIVEDSDTQALQLQLFLEEQGWEVVRASHGEEALDLLNFISPHLLILDYNLPGIRGDELCRKIRVNINTRELPILMLTAEGESKTEQHVLESGADDFVPKQTDGDILQLRIQALLRKKRVEQTIVGSADAYFRKARLLIVDDSPTYREFLAGELSNEGYVVDLVGGGEEALSRILEEKFDCVLLDLVMPGMNGIETCTRITEFRTSMDSPIVVLMLTAQESKDDMIKGLGAGADDFVGKSSDKVVLKARIRALLRRKFYQEETQRIVEELKNKELEVMRANAQKMAAEAKAALTTELEQTAKRLMEEILERERAEVELQKAHDQLEIRVQERTRALAESNDRLERLVWVTSHHLQEPLRKIQVMSDLLARKFNDEPTQDPTLKKFNRLRNAAQRAQLLVDDLVTFSQIAFEADKEFKTVNLSAVVKTVLSTLQDQIKQVDGQIHVHNLPVIKGIPDQLHCLFSHLITNALKFRKNGLPPVISISGVQKAQDGESDNGETSPDSSWQVVVTDNGIGFDEQHQEKIFSVFERLQENRDVEGTGIGLALCRQIIQNHSGSLKARGVPGQGASFLISFSLEEESNRDIRRIPQTICNDG